MRQRSAQLGPQGLHPLTLFTHGQHSRLPPSVSVGHRECGHDQDLQTQPK